MYQITRIATRPNIQVSFFSLSDSYKNYFHNTYVVTGKAVVNSKVLSVDLLTETVISIYLSIDVFNEFINDARNKTENIELLEQYCANNGITLSFSNEEIE